MFRLPFATSRNRRDPFWELDGSAARSTRRRRRAVGSMAFGVSLAAVAMAAAAWLTAAGVAGSVAIRAALGLG